MNENEKLREFWNNTLASTKPEKVEGKWIQQESFNSLVHQYFKDGDNILDYGCGSGWGLIELYFSFNNLTGIGIDQSKNGVEYGNGCLKESGIDKIRFEVGDEETLAKYEDQFDGAISINTIDVLQDDVIEKILSAISKSLKKDAYLLVGINPDFPNEFLEKMGYVVENGYLKKDGILRGNLKTIEEWNELFAKYFEVVENTTFMVDEREKQYPRRMFVLRNIK